MLILDLNHQPRDPGYWHFNNTILDDAIFNTEICKFWSQWLTEKPNFPTLLEWWVSVKQNFKRIAIKRSVTLRKLERSEYNRLSRDLDRLKIAASTGNPTAMEQYLLAKKQLTDLEQRNYGGAFRTKMQSNRDLHSIGWYPCSIGSYLSSMRSYFHSIRSYFHSTGSYLSSIRSYFNYFVASYMTLVYFSVVFHIYPYLRGNSIPSDRNYRSAVVTIWSAVKRGRLNIDLVLVWRHTTYDYMTYN